VESVNVDRQCASECTSGLAGYRPGLARLSAAVAVWVDRGALRSAAACIPTCLQTLHTHTHTHCCAAVHSTSVSTSSRACTPACARRTLSLPVYNFTEEHLPDERGHVTPRDVIVVVGSK